MTTVDVLQDGRWLPLREAALVLHVAEKTVRRRVKAATLRGRQVSTVHGDAWEVWVPTGPPHTQQDSPVGTQSPELLRALDLVDKLQQQNVELAGRLGFLQAELQQRDEQLKALQAPREEAATIETVESFSVNQVERSKPRPSWWRRLLLGE